MLLLWTLGTSPHPQSTRIVNVNLNLFPWFCWWSRGKIKWLTTSQNTWGELDSQAWQPRHPRHNPPLQTAGCCESWSQALCSKKIFQVFFIFSKIHGDLYYLLFVYLCKFSFLLRPCCACSGLRCSVVPRTETGGVCGDHLVITDHWHSAGRGCVSWWLNTRQSGAGAGRAEHVDNIRIMGLVYLTPQPSGVPGPLWGTGHCFHWPGWGPWHDRGPERRTGKTTALLDTRKYWLWAPEVC